jgi:hypothetical protein
MVFWGLLETGGLQRVKPRKESWRGEVAVLMGKKMGGIRYWAQISDWSAIDEQKIKEKEHSLNDDVRVISPLSCLSSTASLEPSGFLCVVFLLLELKAPPRAPKTLRFRPADALALLLWECSSTS